MSEYSEMRCPYCGDDGPTFTWEWQARKTLAIRATCTSCGKYIRWVGQTPENEAIAGPKPSFPPPLPETKPDAQGKLF